MRPGGNTPATAICMGAVPGGAHRSLCAQVEVRGMLTRGCQQQQQLKVPMRIREDSREERKAPVLVEVHIEADAQSSTPRNLMCFQVSAARATPRASDPAGVLGGPHPPRSGRPLRKHARMRAGAVAC